MAQANDVRFSKRVREIDRRHRKLSRGYVQLVERDGLLIPVAYRPARRRFVLKSLFMLLASFLAFKVLLLAYLGPITYADRLGKLTNGSAIEQFGAWIMSADPLTVWAAQQVNQLF